MWDPYRLPVGTGKALVPGPLARYPRSSHVRARGRGGWPAAPVRRMPRAMTLEAELAAAIEAAARGVPPPDFEPWALRVFAQQFEYNAPSRAFCVRRGVTPATVARWEDVPAVPSVAFRQVDLACGPPEAVFVTSGTTNRAARGRHLVPHLALYRCSALASFARFVLPDGVRLPCLAFVPPPALRPASSLVQMCVWVGEALASSIEWMIGERGLETERLLARLAAAEASGEALLLVGMTAAFTKLFAACRTRGRGFRLGPASRVVDTGGQKGTTRPLSRPAFLSECWTLLGIPGYYCINEYGMTELCSQRYDSALDDRFHGRSLAPRRLAGPPWLRTRVLDPDTLAPVAPGTSGLLCHHDLANAGSVSVVLSEDLGRAVGDDGIEVLGRVAHVVASHVPALALPAIALGCLAGAAVLVKSGRDDPLSAPAFQRALAAVDPVLAATVVTAYWPGGEVAREDAALGRAAVVVATGGDATLAALAPRLGRRLIAHGPRWSVALVGRAGAGDVDAIALDTALHDQRGCLSPHAVYVTDDARAFAERLAAAAARSPCSRSSRERRPRGALPPPRVPDVARTPRHRGGARRRLDGVGRRRPRVPGPARRHGGRERRPHAPRGGGGAARAGRAASPRHGVRRVRAGGAGAPRDASRWAPRAPARGRLLHLERRRGDRGRAQDGAQAYPPAAHRRLRGRLPRRHAGRPLDRRKPRLPRTLRAAAARGDAPSLRRRGRAGGDRRAHRGGRGRAGAGRGRRPHPRAGVPAHAPPPLRRDRRAARPRRGGDGLRAHGTSVRAPALGRGAGPARARQGARRRAPARRLHREPGGDGHARPRPAGRARDDLRGAPALLRGRPGGARGGPARGSGGSRRGARRRHARAPLRARRTRRSRRGPRPRPPPRPRVRRGGGVRALRAARARAPPHPQLDAA